MMIYDIILREKNFAIPLNTPALVPTEITREKFIKLQNCCRTLENIRKSILKDSSSKMKDGSGYKFVLENRLIFCAEKKSYM